MNALAFGVLLLTEEQHVLFANRTASDFLNSQDGLRLNGKRLEVMDQISRQKFDSEFQAMRLHKASDNSSSSAYLEIERGADRRAFSAAIFRAPARHQGVTVASHAEFVVVVDSDDMPDVHSSVLQSKYMLSLQEARIVNLLLSGMPLSQVSDDLNITRETARWYMREIFRKMKTNRQQDLIRKLASDATLFAFSQEL